MFDSNRIRSDFSRAAPAYDGNARLQQRVLTQLAQRAQPLLANGACVLDAGCGTGRLIHALPHSRVVPLDIAYAMCAEAARYAPGVNATIEALPFAAATFDAVFCSLVLQWVPDWETAVAQMKRVLKPGGVLAISTLGERTLHELKKSFSAADRFPHVSPFLKQKQLLGAVGHAQEGTLHKHTLVEHYPDLMALMRHLKNLGARNKLSGRRKSLMTAHHMQEVEACYRDSFGGPQGLPVTWEILYSITRI